MKSRYAQTEKKIIAAAEHLDTSIKKGYTEKILPSWLEKAEDEDSQILLDEYPHKDLISKLIMIGNKWKVYRNKKDALEELSQIMTLLKSKNK